MRFACVRVKEREVMIVSKEERYGDQSSLGCTKQDGLEMISFYTLKILRHMSMVQEGEKKKWNIEWVGKVESTLKKGERKEVKQEKVAEPSHLESQK